MFASEEDDDAAETTENGGVALASNEAGCVRVSAENEGGKQKEDASEMVERDSVPEEVETGETKFKGGATVSEEEEENEDEEKDDEGETEEEEEGTTNDANAESAAEKGRDGCTACC